MGIAEIHDKFPQQKQNSFPKLNNHRITIRQKRITLHNYITAMVKNMFHFMIVWSQTHTHNTCAHTHKPVDITVMNLHGLPVTADTLTFPESVTALLMSFLCDSLLFNWCMAPKVVLLPMKEQLDLTCVMQTVRSRPCWQMSGRWNKQNNNKCLHYKMTIAFIAHPMIHIRSMHLSVLNKVNFFLTLSLLLFFMTYEYV